MPEHEDHQEPQATQGSQPSWAQSWQLPMLLLGLVAVVLGIYLAYPEPKTDQFAPVLQEVAQYLKARNPDQAQAILRERLEPFIHRAQPQDQATYCLMWGDVVYQQQEINRWSKPENHQRIVAFYQKARDFGLSLGATHLQRWARTLVAMNRDEEALAVLDQLKDAPARRRYQILRQIIERHKQAGAKIHELAALMARFDTELRGETQQQVRRQQELWLVGMQGQGLLEVGEPEAAMNYLLRQMARLMDDGGDDDLAPLRVLLARSFQGLGEHRQAQRWYRLAQQKLSQIDPLNADVLLGLGQIDLAVSDDVRSALENFSLAESQYPTAPTYIDALIGRADCEARLGLHPESLEHFGLAVKIVTRDLRWRDDQIRRLTDPIRAHFDLKAGRQEYSLALDYLSLLVPLYRSGMPAHLLQDFAVTHEQIAGQRLATFGGTDALPGQGHDTADAPGVGTAARRVAMQEAAMHFGKAGDFYLEHAHAVTGDDDEGFGHSLWAAAISYDKAQHWDKAIEVYAEFMKARPGDPRQLEAINHLGLAYQSAGQYAAGADLFQQLIEEHRHTPEAYESLVPMALCHIAMNAFDAAERVLLYVVTDHPAITPESLHYRRALVELGKLYYKTKRYEEAIARLAESIDRYGQTRQGPTLRFRLADAYRQSIAQMDETLTKVSSQQEKIRLRAERARRLEQGQVLYTEVISEIEAIEGANRSPLEELFLRNAFFYRADCAYDLGRFEQAISLYDLAAKRWDAHPASLVALVQIVNAYCELGKTQEARVANDRARWQLKRIPDEAFDDPTLPMTREHWQDWLRWTSELNLFGPQASAGASR